MFCVPSSYSGEGVMKNLTPERMRCWPTHCPSLRRLEDGRLRIQGEFDREAGISVQRDGGNEAAVIIDAALLDTYVAEKVVEERKAIMNLLGWDERGDGLREESKLFPGTQVCLDSYY